MKCSHCGVQSVASEIVAHEEQCLKMPTGGSIGRAYVSYQTSKFNQRLSKRMNYVKAASAASAATLPPTTKTASSMAQAERASTADRMAQAERTSTASGTVQAERTGTADRTAQAEHASPADGTVQAEHASMAGGMDADESMLIRDLNHCSSRAKHVLHSAQLPKKVMLAFD